MGRTAEVKRDARIGEAVASKDAKIKDYFTSLGLARTAQVKRDARMAIADTEKISRIKEAQADEKRLIARYANDIEIAKSKRDFDLKQNQYNTEVQAQKAAADLAYSLQAAKTKQRIKEEEMQIKVIERTQQISLQEQEIARREKELDANVRRPAEAEKYRLEKIAEARKQQTILEAQAEAEAIRLKGEAEAFAIEAKGKAEAEQMKKKAEAWREFKEAALVEMMLEALPRVAAEIAAPIAEGVESVKMISTGQGQVGVSKLTGEIMDIMGKVPEMIEKMTGVKLK
uniref:Flotillin C-terminal domain-containing protein n=1 Tax=Romanomermis culicivorax TaxID=13658 RepID=A0A915K9G2_ROMCU